MACLLTPGEASLLGLVEGITEYLPISSTGHLVLVDQWLGFKNSGALLPEQIEAIGAFEIVIQAGAILAVAHLYAKHIHRMIRGLMGKDPEGRLLLLNIVTAFVPAMVLGLLLHKWIKTYLQSAMPVAAALFVGGVVMIVVEKLPFAKAVRARGKGIFDLQLRQAFFIGLMQCLAMWPGTSRSMVTILGGMLMGLNPVAAAEFSFLLGLPTLLAASGYKIMKEGHLVMQYLCPSSLLLGFVVGGVSAWLAVKWLVSFLNSHGLALFGWYRIALAVAVFAML